MTRTLVGPRSDPAGAATRPGGGAIDLDVPLPRQRVGEPTTAGPGASTTDRRSAAGKVAAGAASIVICNWRDLRHPEGGGSELYVEQVARGLAALGNRVTVLCAAVAGSPRDEVRDGVHYRRRGGRFGVYLRAATALLTRRVWADVVVDVQNGLPWLSALVTRRPVVVLVHHVHREQWPIAVGRIGGRLGWLVESRVAPALYRRSRYVTVSDATRRDLAGAGVGSRAAAAEVIHNGTGRLPAPRVQLSRTPRVVVLGRLVPHKRVEVVVEALARLRHSHPDLCVDIVGQGWWEPQLRALVAELGLESRVAFHGFVDDAAKADLLAAAWVHAAPSVKEGWGLSVVEAASLGTPTIAFAGAGGLDESVVNGVTGVLVDGGKEQFAAALGAMLADSARRTAMGVAARNHASRFTWPATVDRWVDVLDRAVLDRR